MFVSIFGFVARHVISVACRRCVWPRCAAAGTRRADVGHTPWTCRRGSWPLSFAHTPLRPRHPGRRRDVTPPCDGVTNRDRHTARRARMSERCCAAALLHRAPRRAPPRTATRGAIHPSHVTGRDETVTRSVACRRDAVTAVPGGSCDGGGPAAAPCRPACPRRRRAPRGRAKMFDARPTLDSLPSRVRRRRRVQLGRAVGKGCRHVVARSRGRGAPGVVRKRGKSVTKRVVAEHSSVLRVDSRCRGGPGARRRRVGDAASTLTYPGTPVIGVPGARIGSKSRAERGREHGLGGLRADPRPSPTTVCGAVLPRRCSLRSRRGARYPETCSPPTSACSS